LTSFIRTIPRTESRSHVDLILRRADHFIPLGFFPRKAIKNDYIYLAYSGKLVGRARIYRISPALDHVIVGSDRKPLDAKCKVEYRGGWERPPHEVNYQGTQGIRYIDTVGFDYLDLEQWSSA
jgi:hypothetical protein